MAVSAKAKRHAAEVSRLLARTYPQAECELNYHSPLELLVAVILSAQCTDRRVNIVTATLFEKYRTARDYATAPQAKLEQDIKSTGFFRNKAKNIRACCQQLIDGHDGHVPRDFDKLVALPGVGRKTANVVLGVAFGEAVGVVVDTHVMRLSRRLGLTKAKLPTKIEVDLMAELPQSDWIDFSHRMIWHGRRICFARKPNCDECPLNEICPRVGVKQVSPSRAK